MKISNKVKLNLRQTYTSSSSGSRQHFISDIIKNNNLSVGAEVGVRFGQVMFHVLDNNENLFMYAVDKDINQFLEKSKMYKTRMSIHEVDSRITPDYVEDKSLDFFFIDASHTYKNVVQDLKAWLPKLKDNGWMIGHDIDYPSVETAVKEIIGEYEVGPDNVWFFKADKDYRGIIKL